jgi:nucleoside-triphosphatase THEP1
MVMPVCFLKKMKNKVFIITGEQGSGKTTFLVQIIEELKRSGIHPKGFIAEGFWLNNERSHFDLIDLSNQHRILFCSKDFNQGWEQIGHFYINPAAIDFGEKILDLAAANQSTLCVIDEIGPFELQNKGWSHSIFSISKSNPELPMIWVVRKNLVQPVIAHFSVENYCLFHAESGNLHIAATKIKDYLETRKNYTINSGSIY